MMHPSSGLLPSLVLAPTLAAQVPFQHVIVDPAPPSDPHCKAVGDLNGDGFVDLVVAGTDGGLVWYEDRSQAGAWTRHVVTPPGSGLGEWSTDAECADLDGDGDDDILLSDWYDSNEMVWFENLGSGQSFLDHAIGSPRAHDIEVGDLDGDGDADFVTRQKHSAGGMFHVWINDGAATSWTRQVFDPPGLTTGEGLALGDVDGDGDPDLVVGRLWFDNVTTQQGVAFLPYAYDPNLLHPDTFVTLADIDGDGRIDFVTAPSEAAGGSGELAWYRAPVNPRLTPWPKTVISAGIETVVHGLAAADMDGDGDVDVVTAEMEQGADPDEVCVHYNLDGAGASWLEQQLSTLGSHSIRVADVGSDGDYDVIGANWSGQVPLELWLNESGTLVAPFCVDGSACPCGNSGAQGSGCTNSTGSAAELQALGSTSVASDDLILTATPVPDRTLGLVFMSRTQRTALPLGDGLLCMQGELFRFKPRNSQAGRLRRGPGLAARSRAEFPPSGWIVPGSTWSFQAWFRDGMGPCARGSNLSTGLVVTFVP